MTKYVIIVLLVFLISCNVDSETIKTEKYNIRIEKVSPRLIKPWGLAFLPKGDLLVTEKRGRLYQITKGKLIQISGLPKIKEIGQGGLLDIAVHPNFEKNRLIYYSFSLETNGLVTTALGRSELIKNQLINTEILFEMAPKTRGGAHFGSRIVFAPMNQLFLSLGERGSVNRAQNINDHGGSIIRLTWDGKIPQDNPFIGNYRAKPEIYSFGHRNPQGLTWDPIRKNLLSTEHGPKGGDELNIIKKGLNYGWPVITYGRGYDNSKIGIGSKKEGMESPIYQWTPSIAPSGLMVYTGKVFPNWRGDIFVGALKFKQLHRLTYKEGEIVAEEILLKNKIGRIRDVRIGPDGYIYLLNDEINGAVFRIIPGD
jgi:glucose/arabinose dehydrogenase